VARGDSKIDIRNIIRAHRQTYSDVRTRRRRIRDSLLIEGMPVAVLVACLSLGVRVDRPTAVGLLTVSGLLSALLFGVMLQVSDRAMSWAESDPEPNRSTSERADFLKQLAANAGYASLICVLSAMTYVAISIPSGWATRWEWPTTLGSAFGIALGAHLVLVILVVMKRVFALTESELNHARTGADRPIGRRKAS
jgi:hypothetical protein